MRHRLYDVLVGSRASDNSCSGREVNRYALNALNVLNGLLHVKSAVVAHHALYPERALCIGDIVAILAATPIATFIIVVASAFATILV